MDFRIVNGLMAPACYWDLEEVSRSEICNGCGAKAGIDWPDTIYGVSIRAACDIHDFMYSKWYRQGLCESLVLNHSYLEDIKDSADYLFLVNMTELVNRNSNLFMGFLRRRRMLKYYEAVMLCGGEVFYKRIVDDD